MEDLFKKFLYTGVGFVALTAEKLEESINELVGKGKISRDEGKKLFDDFLNNSENRKEEFEQKLKEAAENVFDNFAFVKKTEFEALVKRVEELEAKAAKKPASRTRKAPAKKPATKKNPKKGE